MVEKQMAAQWHFSSVPIVFTVCVELYQCETEKECSIHLPYIKKVEKTIDIRPNFCFLV